MGDKSMRLFLLLLIPLFAFGQGRDHFGVPDDFDIGRHDLCRRGRPLSLDDSLHRFNTMKIWSQLSFYLTGSQISGSARYLVAIDVVPLPRIDFRLVASLTVDSVTSLTHAIDSVTRQGLDSLQIYLSPSLELGDTTDFTIYYRGSPTSIDAWGGMRFAQASSWRPQICYTLGDGLNLDPPPANYNWLPSFADPNDKVEWEAWLHVPQNRVGVSAGVRLDTVLHGDSSSTWHYRLDQPVSTYLLFVSVSDYLIMTQRESNPVIENFVYPSRWDQAQVHFEPVPNCLDAFAENFGPYAFDRFGFNMARNGDMEHATSVTHYDGAVVSNRSWDWILFHELAHHWWGNWVTVADWRDLWLNEGFATYCEALGMEWVRGDLEFRNYMRTDIQPTARNAGNQSTIYDPDYYWGGIVYEKGASVLHMLRWVMGDSLFFTALRDYGQQFAFGNATSVEFQTVCESHYDSTLQWFFNQWIFEGTGFPQYEVIYDAISVPQLFVNQNQSTTYFTMPMEIQGYVHDAIITDTIWVTPDENGEWMTNDIELYDSVKIDPNGWLLKTATHQTFTPATDPLIAPNDFRVISAYPNPFNPTLTIAFESPREQKIQMRAYNVQGQLVFDQDARAGIGANQFVWNAASQASGIYWIQLSTQAETRTIKAVLLK